MPMPNASRNTGTTRSRRPRSPSARCRRNGEQDPWKWRTAPGRAGSATPAARGTRSPRCRRGLGVAGARGHEDENEAAVSKASPGPTCPEGRAPAEVLAQPGGRGHSDHVGDRQTQHHHGDGAPLAARRARPRPAQRPRSRRRAAPRWNRKTASSRRSAPTALKPLATANRAIKAISRSDGTSARPAPPAPARR